MAGQNAANVVSLRQHLGENELPSFLVLKVKVSSDKNEQRKLFVLTTKVMHWGGDYWLLDLSNMLTYWKWVARQKGFQLFELYEAILEQTFSNFTAAFAYHPWQALLFCEALEQRGEKLMSLGTPLGNQLFRGHHFSCWLPHLGFFKEHLKARKLEKNFSSKMNQWQMFLDRMGITRPFDVTHLTPESLSRRFGKWWESLWKWTFSGLPEAFDAPSSSVQTDLFSSSLIESKDEFYWQDHELEAPPTVERFLEFPLLDWEHISDQLRDDCESLCQQNRDLKFKRVTRLEWQLTFENMKAESCQLVFRNPYDLAADGPDYSSALFQAYYSFLEVTKKIKKRDDDLDFPINMAVSSWKLKIRELMELPALNTDLFGTLSQKLSRQMEMQNKLPRELQSYQLEPTFSPEHSYALSSLPKKRDFNLAQWTVSALKRPLFIYSKVVGLEPSRHWQKSFLERVGESWWTGDLEGSENQAFDRDYYIVEMESGAFYWLFRNSLGRWYRHGIFS
ncbi:MAG: hypothetical protein HN509_09030 [Halobacteriovoraceae bacterium]|nr:hypothetical protein [Halobacteriovoraceae bacterium]MBT5093693.1 hypothetical protein [Halobacteriovoraceae bacterium]